MFRSVPSKHGAHHADAHGGVAGEHDNMIALLQKITHLDTTVQAEVHAIGTIEDQMTDVEDED